MGNDDSVFCPSSYLMTPRDNNTYSHSMVLTEEQRKSTKRTATHSFVSPITILPSRDYTRSISAWPAEAVHTNFSTPTTRRETTTVAGGRAIEFILS